MRASEGACEKLSCGAKLASNPFFSHVDILQNARRRIKEADDEASPFPEDVGGSEGVFLQVVGDECISTNEDIIRAEEKQTFNAVALSLAKAKTVSGFIGLWQKAER